MTEAYGRIARRLSSSLNPTVRKILIELSIQAFAMRRFAVKAPRRIGRLIVRRARVQANRFCIHLARVGVRNMWVARLILQTSPEYECNDADVWFDALERVLIDRPGAILQHRKGAFYRAWCSGDIHQSMDFMDRYRNHQVLLRAEAGLASVPISISRDIFTSNYTVHAFLDTHLKAMKLGWAPEREIIAPLSKKSRVWNPVMTRYWGRYVTTVRLGDEELPALDALEPLFNEDLTIAATIHGRSVYIEHAKAQVQTEWERQGRSPLLTFDEADAVVCAREMEALGLPAGAPFVTLHVRDNGSKTGSWTTSGTSDDFRNADISTYLEAVKIITERDWYVVRVGDPAMKPVPPQKGLIDYAHSSIRSNLLDVYLFSQCKFFIGTSSGPILIPHVFGTPILGTNYAPLSARLHAGNTLLLLKRLRHQSGRYVPFSEALESPVGSLFLGESVAEAGYRYEDNTSEEIADAVQEMLYVVEQKIQYSAEDNHLHALITSVYSRYGGYGSLGRIAQSFARKCQELQMMQSSTDARDHNYCDQV